MNNLPQQNKKIMFEKASNLMQLLEEYVLTPDFSNENTSITSKIKTIGKTNQSLERTIKKLKSDLSTLMLFYPDYTYKKTPQQFNDPAHTCVKFKEALDIALLDEKNPAIHAFARRCTSTLKKVISFNPKILRAKEFTIDKEM